ncbi:hypothetical protein [Roseovarius pacificus]|uniref:hypothetical protein n=1 Tax=Roseovarius pacificus TaxID=337701 RepID=UPI002A189316|nr:hypothetical protein [Roseovarius pacificus]
MKYCAFLCFGLALAIVPLLGCPPQDTIDREIESAVSDLADNSMEADLAAVRLAESTLKAYRTNDAQFVADNLRQSVNALGTSPNTLQELAERSTDIASQLIELDAHEAKQTPRNVVLFVNGIQTTYCDYLSSLFALDEKLKPLHQTRDFDVAGLYNPTGGLWMDLGNESVVQKILDWLKVYQLLRKDAFDDQYRQHLNYLLGRYDNLIIMAHSQGNFYTQDAISSIPINTRTHINVIQVGSPAENWPAGLRNNVRVDMIGDPVSCLSGDVLSGYDYAQGGNPIFETLKHFAYPGLYLSYTLSEAIACWGVGLPYDISAEEFFYYHHFESYLLGNAGQAIYNNVDSFFVDGEPLNEVNIAGQWVFTDITEATGGRPYDQYHTTITLYPDGSSDYTECRVTCNNGTAEWSFDADIGEFYFISDGGAEFVASVVGDSDTFIADGFWTNGNAGTILFVRQGKELYRVNEPDYSLPSAVGCQIAP